MDNWTHTPDKWCCSTLSHVQIRPFSGIHFLSGSTRAYISCELILVDECTQAPSHAWCPKCDYLIFFFFPPIRSRYLSTYQVTRGASGWHHRPSEQKRVWKHLEDLQILITSFSVITDNELCCGIYIWLSKSGFIHFDHSFTALYTYRTMQKCRQSSHSRSLWCLYVYVDHQFVISCSQSLYNTVKAIFSQAALRWHVYIQSHPSLRSVITPRPLGE